MTKCDCIRFGLRKAFSAGKKKLQVFATIILFNSYAATAQEVTVTTTPVKVADSIYRVPAGRNGWAYNSVNGVVFRKNSLVTYQDTQYIAFYDSAKNVVLGKRKIGESTWVLRTSPYTGNTTDAHNSISIIVDGAGYLHVSWDHHNNALHYARSTAPGALTLGAQTAMTGRNETSVSYPEFYTLPNGDLMFFYRDGASGNGNTVLNRYKISSRTWTQVQSNLISGEGARSAYTQTTIDRFGYIHVSWVWRESSNVASNHDMNYAVSYDGGVTWKKSTGTSYSLPIVQATAEKIATIPQNSDLINQTSITTDEDGKPYIATYWKETNGAAPQYHIIYKSASGWAVENLGFRTQNFSLAGIGTQVIPISRPQLLVWKRGNYIKAVVVFRDIERNKRLSLATNDSLGVAGWRLIDAGTDPIGDWEPSFDTELWRTAKMIHIFGQYMLQGPNETTTNTPPQPVFVLQVDTAVRGTTAAVFADTIATSVYGNWSGSEVLGQQYLPNRTGRATALSGTINFTSSSSGTGVSVIASSGKATTSTTTTEYYIPKTDTGSAVARLQAYTSAAFTYKADSALFLRQSSSANVNKFSIHNLTSTATASLRFGIQFTTAATSNAAATYALSIGRESGSGSYDNNTASVSSSTNISGMFTALRWAITSAGAITLSYRTGASAYTAVSSLSTDTTRATYYTPFTFAKGQAYTIKVWCNNTATIIGYYIVQGRKYQLAPATYDVWVNNHKVLTGLPSLRKVSGSYGVASGDSGASLNAFAIEGVTNGGSTNEYIRLTNLEWKAAINNATARTAASGTATTVDAVQIEKISLQAASMFIVYPTLVENETISVRFGKLSNKVEIKLVSLDGKLVLRKEVPATYSQQTLILKTGQVLPGAYILLVRDKKATQSTRIVIQ